MPAIKDAEFGGRGGQLLQSLAQYSAKREAEIEGICSVNHQGLFLPSISFLQFATEVLL